MKKASAGKGLRKVGVSACKETGGLCNGESELLKGKTSGVAKWRH